MLFALHRFGLRPVAGSGASSLAMLPVTAADGACLTAPPIVCTLDDTAALPYTVVSIECSVPPGAGVGWKLSIRGFWVGLGPVVGYAAPTISVVVPLVLPIEGGQVTIVGTNFGPAPCAFAGPSRVDFRVTQLTGPASFNTSSGQWSPSDTLAVVRVRCNVTAWSPGSINCTAPPGLDSEVTVQVVVGGQAGESAAAVGFAAPTVLSFATAGRVGTAGGALLLITGSGFPDPPWPLVVAVGPHLCALVPGGRSHTAVNCTLPRGWGRQPIVVQTPLQASLQPMVLQYDGPMISSVATPGGRPIEGGFLIEVQGQVRDHCALLSRH